MVGRMQKRALSQARQNRPANDRMESGGYQGSPAEAFGKSGRVNTIRIPVPGRQWRPFFLPCSRCTNVE